MRSPYRGVVDRAAFRRVSSSRRERPYGCFVAGAPIRPSFSLLPTTVNRVVSTAFTPFTAWMAVDT